MCYIRPVYTTCAGWADKKILPRVLSRRPHSYGSEDGHFSSPLGHLATQKHWHSTFNSLLEYMNLSKRTAHLSYGHLTEKTSSWSFCDVHVLQKEDEKPNDVNAILANKCTFGGKRAVNFRGKLRDCKDAWNYCRRLRKCDRLTSSINVIRVATI